MLVSSGCCVFYFHTAHKHLF